MFDLLIINKIDELSDIYEELRNIENVYEKIDEILFDFNRKRMSVLVKNKNKNIGIEMVIKGVVEEIFFVCNILELNGSVVVLD